MEELHILDLKGFKIFPDDFSKWSQALRFLRFKCMICDGIPTGLKLSNLAVLDISGSWVDRLWEDGATMQFSALRMLFLDGCKSLITLPDSFGLSLLGLQTLTMSYFCKIERLLESFARLVNLKNLDLSFCSQLRELPEEFGSLVKLEDLNLWLCMELLKLPSSFGGLKMLKRLIMDNCGVQELPMNFGELSCLDFLSFWMCDNELQSLTALQVEARYLDLGRRLISSLDAFELLTDLWLLDHETITSLLKSIGSLKFLVRLEMYRCQNLQTIEALPLNLHHLDLNGCDRLTRIASFGKMRLLVFLNLADCDCLRHVNGLERLEALQYVNLMGCKSIEDCVVLGRHKARALCECYLSGSGFYVAYNNKWLEEEPMLQ